MSERAREREKRMVSLVSIVVSVVVVFFFFFEFRVLLSSSLGAFHSVPVGAIDARA